MGLLVLAGALASVLTSSVLRGLSVYLPQGVHPLAGSFTIEFVYYQKSRMHGQKGALAAPTRIGIAAPGIDRLNIFCRMHPALDIVFFVCVASIRLI